MAASVIELGDDAGLMPSRQGLVAGALIGAAGLVGFAIIMWIAANWSDIGRFTRFGLVGGAAAAGALGAVALPRHKTAGLLVAFCAAGGLFALIGQTYQTGADPWQLFALWAALALPWALAARSDAIWTPWVIVTATAVTLFQQSAGVVETPFARAAAVPFDIFTPGSASFTLLATWLILLALVALLSPGSRAGHWIGHRVWSHRLAVLLTLSNIAAFTMMAVLMNSSVKLDVALIGIALLGATAFALARNRPRDALLLAAATLAVDVVVIAGVMRAISPSFRSSEFASFFTIGIASALIVAGSVVVLLRVLGGMARTAEQGVQKVRDVAGSEGVRPWPVIVLSGIGALIASIPLIVAIAILLGPALTSGGGAYLIGALSLAAGLSVMRSAAGLFVEQLGAIAFVAGTLLLAFAFHRDLPLALASVLIGCAAISIALWLGKPWASGLLGALAAIAFAFAAAHVLSGRKYGFAPGALSFAWCVLAGGWAAAVLAAREGRQWLEPLRDSANGDAILIGWIGAVLFGLSYGGGPTFLLEATIGSGGSHGAGTVLLHLGAYLQRGLGLVLAIVAAAIAAQRSEAMRTPTGWVILATVAALSWLKPSLGAVALVLAVAGVTGRRVIALAAAAALLWVAGSFYYDLSLTLTQKAALLGGAGVALGAVALAAGASLERLQRRDGEPGPVASQGLVRGLAAIGFAAVALVSVQAINEKETLIRDGRPVFIALAPVDPRSLMQGDYMALRFVLPDAALRHQPTAGTRPLAIGRIDATGVAHLARIGDSRSPLAADEIRIALATKNRRWIVVTDAWFFKEGTAERWEAARYGEFRVLPDGRALLVGMADKDRRRIE